MENFFSTEFGLGFIVCFAKILEITIQSMKTVCMVKGETKVAALLGFTECTVWGLVISSIITKLSSNPWLLFSYGFGYAIGLYLGSILEKKIGLGTRSIKIIANKKNTDEIVAYIKEKGHGFTVLPGYGATEPMNMILIIVPRRESYKIEGYIKKNWKEGVFTISSDINDFNGGYGIRK